MRKDQSGADGEERAEEEGRVHIFITKLLEEEEEGRERIVDGPADLLAPLEKHSIFKLHRQ